MSYMREEDHQPYFEQLTILFQRCIDQPDIDTHHKQFTGGLRNTNRRFSKYSEPEINVPLAGFWLKHFSLHLARGTKEPYSLDEFEDYDEFVKLVSKHGNIDAIAKEASDANTLAHVCMYRVWLGTRNTPHSGSYSVIDVLAQWTGQPIAPTVTASLRSTVDLLYGPAVWTIYRNDDESNRDFMDTLWRLQLPLAGVKKTAPALSFTANVPRDFA